MAWHWYILENELGRFYVGSTGRPPEFRLAEHNAGLSRWTRAHGPWRLVYWETYNDKHPALARERFLKTGGGGRAGQRVVGGRSREAPVWIESASGGEGEPGGPPPKADAERAILISSP